MNQSLAAFICALLFGIGLGVSGMTLPSKVHGFLDVFGEWDPSLALVMVGAIAVHGFLYRIILQRSSPVFATRFQIPATQKVDSRLVIGSLLFGLGWGLGGFCPGPALVASVTGNSSVLLFVLSMAAGIYAYRIFYRTFFLKQE